MRKGPLAEGPSVSREKEEVERHTLYIFKLVGFRDEVRQGHDRETIVKLLDRDLQFELFFRSHRCFAELGGGVGEWEGQI